MTHHAGKDGNLTTPLAPTSVSIATTRVARGTVPRDAAEVKVPV